MHTQIPGPSRRKCLMNCFMPFPKARIGYERSNFKTPAGAADAISGILETRPDLVVLDVHLAEGSGFDVLRALHAQAPELEVVVLTNYSADPYRQIAERFGARALFDKTREFERVRDLVA